MNASLADAVRFLALLAAPGDVFELRGLQKGRSVPQVTAGYFDDMQALADAAIARSGKDDGVYITLNPVNPALLARAPANRVRQAGNGDTTSDRDVRARRHILVDVDPVRPTGISSTNDEHAAAIALATRISSELGQAGWPEPILADSGNGGHLIYAIDLPVDDGGLVKRVLAELSKRYTTPEHKVDEKVFNPARISKMYGTLTRKGENTADRPHRVARILQAPDRLAVVPREVLETIAPTPQAAQRPDRRGERSPFDRPQQYDRPQFDLDGWIAQHLPDAVAQPWSEGRKWLLPICPFNDSHNRREAYITEKHGGMIAAGCQHESCFKSWRELRQRFEPDAYERRLADGTQPGKTKVTDREPPPEVVYQDERYAAELEAFADRDREPARPAAREVEVPVRLMTLAEAMDDLAALASAPVFDTPFPTLNSAIGFGGLIGTQVYTVCAGTGRGKTSWVACVAAHTAGQGVPVIIATYEMKPGYFVARRAAGLMRVHSNDIIRGDAAMRERALAAMNYPDMFLMRKPSLRELRAAVEQVTKRYGRPPLVIVDYLQKLTDEIASRQARPDLRMATTEASSTLLDIAESTSAAIIAVSAIGRGKGKAMSTPRKFDPYELVEVAKESGAVEYDGAGLIVLTLSSEVLAGGARVGTMTLAKTRFGTEMHIDSRYYGSRGDWYDEGEVARKAAANAELDEAAANVTPLREAILDALRRHGPQTSKTKIVSISERNRDAAFAEVEKMMKDGTLLKEGRFITIATGSAPAPVMDRLLPGLIAQAEKEGLE